MSTDRLLKIAESRLHVWFLVVGTTMAVGGVAAYFSWPFLEQMWRDDLALARALNLERQIYRSYDMWRTLCTKGGPALVAGGAVLAVIGLILSRVKSFRLNRLAKMEREGLDSLP